MLDDFELLNLIGNRLSKKYDSGYPPLQDALALNDSFNYQFRIFKSFSESILV